MKRIHRSGPSANAFQAWVRLASNSTRMLMTSAEVIGMRTHRMASGGLNASPRDRGELALMGQEKVAAAIDSGQAMARSMFALNQQLMAMWFRQMLAGAPMLFSLAASRSPSRLSAAQVRIARAALANSRAATTTVAAAVPRIAGKGLKPVHTRAAANKRRLARR